MVIGTLTSRGQKFTEGDAFIGYQKDTPAAVVFQATQATPVEWGRMEHVSVPGTKADEEEEEVEDSHIWKEDVSSLVVLLMQWQQKHFSFGQTNIVEEIYMYVCTDAAEQLIICAKCGKFSEFMT